jgi:hypothetical protein
MSSLQIVQIDVMGGTYQSGMANFMSPGEATYFLVAAFTANSFMSKVNGNIEDAEVVAALKIIFAEPDQEKQKPVYAKLMRHLAETSYFTWIGYFAAANLWRDRVKNFKPSRGLTISVYDVSVT